MAKVGRPNYKFTKEQLALADDMAINWCQDNTIAVRLGVKVDTLTLNLGKRLREKRAQAKQDLRTLQAKQALKTPIMAIFLGKNYLGQADKQDHKFGLDEQTSSLLAMIDGKGKNQLPSEENNGKDTGRAGESLPTEGA